MTLAWRGAVQVEEVAAFGALALFQPLLQQLDIAPIIDRHLPPDPQQEFSHGEILTLLLAARLCQPTALVNLADWAEHSGADLLWGIPADKLNDDRFGRALDAFFEQRHSVLAGVTSEALRLVKGGLQRIHFDPTHVTFFGAYDSSEPRSKIPLDDLVGDSQLSLRQAKSGKGGRNVRGILETFRWNPAGNQSRSVVLAGSGKRVLRPLWETRHRANQAGEA